MEISFDRLKHSLEVAKKMKKIVLENQEKYSCTPEDMFILGLVHDIGYEFANEQPQHAVVGGIALKNQGYKYWKEVYYHSRIQNEYMSNELLLLNYADMTTGPHGESMSLTQRHEDVVKRYGKGSHQDLEVAEVIKQLVEFEK